MKTTVRAFSLILLVFTSVSACFGGYMLISAPDGSRLQMPVEWLAHAPFPNYLIPGIILLVVNGLFSFFAAIMVVLRHRIYPLLVISQGIILCGWIMTQISLIRMMSWLQLLYGLTGIFLCLAGLLLVRLEKEERLTAGAA